MNNDREHMFIKMVRDRLVIPTRNRRPIVHYDVDGNVIGEYESVGAAKYKNGVVSEASVYKSLNGGKLKNGHVFEYAENVAGAMITPHPYIDRPIKIKATYDGDVIRYIVTFPIDYDYTASRRGLSVDTKEEAFTLVCDYINEVVSNYE